MTNERLQEDTYRMGIKTVQYQNLSFVNIENPGETEIKYLRRYYPFHPLNLDDYLTKTQRPKIEQYRHYILVVLDFPYFRREGQAAKKLMELLMMPRKTLQRLILPSEGQILKGPESIERMYLSEVAIFIGKEYLVVLHEGNLPTINQLFERCQKTLAGRKKYMGEGVPFLFYNLIDHLVDYSATVLDKTGSDVDLVDKRIINSPTEEIVSQISIIRRNIVLFHTMIKPIIPLFQSLENGKVDRLNGELTEFWTNLVNHLQGIIDRIDDARELIEGLSTSTESVLTLQTNKIIKILTMFSAIILPLTLLSGIYGMNIPLPFADNPTAFGFITFLMLILITTMIVFFKLRRWL